MTKILYLSFTLNFLTSFGTLFHTNRETSLAGPTRAYVNSILFYIVSVLLYRPILNYGFCYNVVLNYWIMFLSNLFSGVNKNLRYY